MRFPHAWIPCVVFGALCSARTAQPLSEEMVAQAEQALERQRSVRETADIIYGTVDGFELKGDLYLPDTEGGNRPGMLMIHGGGDKATIGHFRKASKRYAAMRFVVFNVNYRLSREAPAPAAVEDVKSALRFMHAQAGEWKMDSTRIVATGGSAGSHLALMAGLCDAYGTGESVAAVLNRSGITDVHDLTFGQNPRGWAQKWLPPETPDGEALARRVSPLSYASRPKLPAVYSIHGMEDDIVPVEHAMKLHLALLKNGHRSELFLLPFTGHGATLGRHTEIQEALNTEINLRIADFFFRNEIL